MFERPVQYIWKWIPLHYGLLNAYLSPYMVGFSYNSNQFCDRFLKKCFVPFGAMLNTSIVESYNVRFSHVQTQSPFPHILTTHTHPHTLHSPTPHPHHPHTPHSPFSPPTPPLPTLTTYTHHTPHPHHPHTPHSPSTHITLPTHHLPHSPHHTPHTPHSQHTPTHPPVQEYLVPYCSCPPSALERGCPGHQ